MEKHHTSNAFKVALYSNLLVIIPHIPDSYSDI